MTNTNLVELYGLAVLFLVTKDMATRLGVGLSGPLCAPVQRVPVTVHWPQPPEEDKLEGTCQQGCADESSFSSSLVHRKGSVCFQGLS